MLRVIGGTGLAVALAAVAVGAGWHYRFADEAKRQAEALTGGDPKAGGEAVRRIGCGACHRIPGVTGAAGTIGPPLDRWSQRAYIAGVLPNTPANLIVWIGHARDLLPSGAMPNLDLDEAARRDVAAYLYTLD